MKPKSWEAEGLPLNENGEVIKPRPAGTTRVVSAIRKQRIKNNSKCLFCSEFILWKSVRFGNQWIWTPYNSDGSRHVLTCRSESRIKSSS